MSVYLNVFRAHLVCVQYRPLRAPGMGRFPVVVSLYVFRPCVFMVPRVFWYGHGAVEPGACNELPLVLG